MSPHTSNPVAPSSGYLFTANTGTTLIPAESRGVEGWLSGLSADVAKFSREQNLGTYLILAMGMARKYFGTAGGFVWHLETDVETCDRWLTLSFEVYGMLDEVLEQYHAFTSSWVDLVPWPQSDIIRIDYHLPEE